MDEANVFRGWLEVGTSWGLFRSDLEEMATAAVVEAVRFARPQGSPVLPLSRWAEREKDLLRRRTLEATVAFWHQCRELHRLSLKAESGEELEHFGKLYREVARLGAQRHQSFWNSIPAQFQDTPGTLNSEVPCGQWVEDRWVELALAEGAGQSATAVVDRVRARLDRPLPGVESWLPAQPKAARRVLLELLDLALMSPVGRVHGAAPAALLPRTLLPGWRLLALASLLRNGSRGVLGETWIEHWIENLCDADGLRWPTPAWIAFKVREKAPPSVPGFSALRRVQRAAAGLRRQTADSGTMAELSAKSEELRLLGRRALAVRRRADLVAAGVEVWIRGTLPPPSPALAVWPRKRFHRRLAQIFEELFRIPLGSLLTVPEGQRSSDSAATAARLPPSPGRGPERGPGLSTGQSFAR